MKQARIDARRLAAIAAATIHGKTRRNSAHHSPFSGDRQSIIINARPTSDWVPHLLRLTLILSLAPPKPTGRSLQNAPPERRPYPRVNHMSPKNQRLAHCVFTYPVSTAFIGERPAAARSSVPKTQHVRCRSNPGGAARPPGTFTSENGESERFGGNRTTPISVVGVSVQATTMPGSISEITSSTPDGGAFQTVQRAGRHAVLRRRRNCRRSTSGRSRYWSHCRRPGAACPRRTRRSRPPRRRPPAPWTDDHGRGGFRQHEGLERHIAKFQRGDRPRCAAERKNRAVGSDTGEAQSDSWIGNSTCSAACGCGSSGWSAALSVKRARDQRFGRFRQCPGRPPGSSNGGGPPLVQHLGARLHRHFARHRIGVQRHHQP